MIKGHGKKKTFIYLSYIEMCVNEKKFDTNLFLGIYFYFVQCNVIV